MELKVRGAILVALLTGLPCAERGAAQPATQPVALTVQVKGFVGKEGQALVTIYKSEDAWMKVPKALQVIKKKITGPRLKVKFRGLAAGTYGVLVIHDADKNDKLNMRWLPFPKPKEGLGVSNDPKFTKAPTWQDAKFSLGSADQAITVTMRYP